MNTWRHKVRDIVSRILFSFGLFTVLLPVYATEQAQQRRQARDVRQDTRHQSRDTKQNCRAANQKSNAGCRQDKRHTKQGGRQQARDIKY